ncbi:glucokinase [Fodinibius roseus]|uniref:Glucokinase n=1 Tax=Fodinibius roseus TaxID=1194090 RepID=A0A1M5CLC3_9BACT|nr:ROK family protein [Fodinibius roseus]SHF55523.1 glucokinase [Fodinibius roseus]
MNTEEMKQQSFVGVDLGATNVRVGRVRGNSIEQLEGEEIVDSNDPSDLLTQIEVLIRKVITSDVIGVGIGVPSVVDVEEGIVYDVQNIPSWEKVPVKRILEEKLNKPVYVNNDSNCFVLGEKFFGKGLGCESVVGLTLGSGFGSGLILNDQLYFGDHCGAGEVGMLPYKDSIFEHYCSGMFFERAYDVSGKQVYENARKGRESAKKMYKAFGTHLGNGIKAVMYAYDPQLIILGGTIRKAYPYFKESMFRAMQDFAYSNSLASIRIEVSELDEVSVLGAAALSFEGK